jgi:pathogenesis-related protein 1
MRSALLPFAMLVIGCSSSGSSASSGSSGGSSSGGGDDGEQAWLAPMNAARTAVGESPLRWDSIAAGVAQAWASQCNYEHNPGASSQYAAAGGTGGLGENLAAGAPTLDVAGAVSAWVGEEQNYDHATNSCAAGDECGHYTQIVWSTTTAVGCAVRLQSTRELCR